MAVTSVLTPDPNFVIYTNTGLAFSQVFDYFYSDDNSGYAVDIALVAAPGSSSVLPAGATVFPGVVVNAGTYPAPVGPLNGVTISGTPTLAGTYSIYVRARYISGLVTFDNFAVVTVVVGGNSLMLTPDNSFEITTGLTQNSYISAPFSITNGSGAYRLTAQGLPPGLGLSRTAVVQATPTNVLSLTGDTFYITGTPTLSGVYSNIQITIADSVSKQVTVTPLYSLTINNASAGTLTISKTSQNPITLLQEEAAQIVYGASGGSGSYSWNLTGTLPTGLVFTQVGNQSVITGTPTVYGTFTGPSLGALSGGSVAGSLALTFQITPNVVVRGTVPSTATVGTPYSGSLTIAGGDGNSSFGFEVVGIAPSWLTITRSGATLNFSGTPDNAAISSFSIRAASTLGSGGTIYSSLTPVTIEATGTASPTNIVATFNGTPLIPDGNTFDVFYNQYTQVNTAYELVFDYSAEPVSFVKYKLNFYGVSFYTNIGSGYLVDLSSVSFPYYVGKSLDLGLSFVITSHDTIGKKITLKALKNDLSTKAYSYPNQTPATNKIIELRGTDDDIVYVKLAEIYLNITPEILYNAANSTGVSSYSDITKTITMNAATKDQAYGPYKVAFDLPDVGGNGEPGTAWNDTKIQYVVTGSIPGLSFSKSALSGEKYRPKLLISGTPTASGAYTVIVEAIQQYPMTGVEVLRRSFNLVINVSGGSGGPGNSAITLQNTQFATAGAGSNSIDFKTTAGGTYYIKTKVKHQASDATPNSVWFLTGFDTNIPSIGSDFEEPPASGDYYHIYGPFSQDTFYRLYIIPLDFITTYSAVYPFTLTFQVSTSSDTTSFGTSKQFTVKYYDEAGPSNYVTYSGASYQIVNPYVYMFEGQSFTVRGVPTDWDSKTLAAIKGDWKLSKAPGFALPPVGSLQSGTGLSNVYTLPASTLSSVPGNCAIEYNAYETNVVSGEVITAGYANTWFLTLPRSDANFNLNCQEGTCTFNASAVGDTYTLTPTGGSGTFVYSSYYNISTDFPWLTIENVNGNCVLRVTGEITQSITKTIIIKAVRNNNAITSKVVKVVGDPSGGGGGITTVDSITPSTYSITGPELTGVTVTGTNLAAVDFIRIRLQGTGVYQNYVPTSNTGTVIEITLNAGGVPWGGAAGLCDIEAITADATILAILAGAFTWSATPVLSVGTVSPNSIQAIGSPIDKVIQVTGTNFNNSCKVLYDPKGNVGDRIELVTTYNSGVLSATIPSVWLGVDDIYATNTVNVKDYLSGAVTTSGANIAIVPTSVSISTGSLPNAVIGSAYSTSLAAEGGVSPYVNWTVNPALPDGLSLNSSTGAITGTPLVTALTKDLVFSVQDSAVPAQNASKALTISVTGGASISIVTSSLFQATIGSPYSMTLQATGGVLPYSWSVTSGQLPAGITLSSSGVLSGTAASNNTPGNYTFTVRVQDSTGGTPLSATTTFTLILNTQQSAVSITSFSPATGPVDGGTPVTINGTGFASGVTVYFGNNVARNIQLLNNGTTITCVTPAASSQINPLDLVVYLRVVNTDGGQATSISTYEYTIQSVPTIISIDKQDGPFSGGQAVVLYGTNFTSDVVFKFGLDFGSSFNATITSVDLQSNPQRIYATTPTWSLPHDNVGRVDVNLYVQNSSGIGTLSAGDNGYTYRAAPVITGIVPASGPSSGGNTVYVLGRYFFSRGASKPRVFIGSVEVPPENIILVEE